MWFQFIIALCCKDEDNVYLLLEYCAKGELYQLLRYLGIRKLSRPPQKR